MSQGNFIDPQEFPNYKPANPKQGTGPKYHGYPNGAGQDAQAWDKPHWHGDDTYNPHLRVMINEPDGTRIYYDPVTGTHSFEHASGYHKAVLQDGIIETVPGKKTSFVGAGGHSEAIGGHHDYTVRGHARHNYAGDVYHNVQGAIHTYAGAGHYQINAGNATEENWGHKKVRLVGENSSFGIGVGKGASDTHNQNFTMTNKRTYINAHGEGDIWHQTQSNNINYQSGKDFNVQAKENISISTDKGDHVTISAKNGTVYIQAANVKVKGNLLVDGNIQYASANGPVHYISNLYTTGGGAGGGSAPTVNVKGPAALDSGSVS